VKGWFTGAAAAEATVVALTEEEIAAANLAKQEAAVLNLATEEAATINLVSDEAAVINLAKNEAAVVNSAANKPVVPFTKLGTDKGMMKVVKWVKREEGWYDVIVHGNEESFWILDETGAWISVNQRTMATYISRTGYNGKMPIRLLSCNSGKLPDGIARNLSNKLGVTVKAPNNTLWVYESGEMVIGPTQYENSGGWTTFTKWNEPPTTVLNSAEGTSGVTNAVKNEVSVTTNAVKNEVNATTNAVKNEVVAVNAGKNAKLDSFVLIEDIPGGAQDPAYVSTLVQELKAAQGAWPWKAIRVVQVDGKNIILDGAHRYQAALEFGYKGDVPLEIVPVEESGYTITQLRGFLE
jgi:hypothetical protein